MESVEKALQSLPDEGEGMVVTYDDVIRSFDALEAAQGCAQPINASMWWFVSILTSMSGCDGEPSPPCLEALGIVPCFHPSGTLSSSECNRG